jgi:TPR repeat protein
MTSRRLAALAAALGLSLSIGGGVIAEPLPGAEEAFEGGIKAYRAGDFGTAAADWTRAAEAGHAVAAFLLGSLYEQGRGVTPSEGTAFRYYLQAAEGGNPQAADKVGLIYRDGNKALGIKRDYARALKMFETGALAAWPPSQYHLAGMYRKGLGVPLSRAESLRWLLLAAGKRHAPSLLELARIHFEGDGVTVNRVEGWTYLDLAGRFADRDEAPLVNAAIDKYAPRMKPGEREEASTAAEAWLAEHPAGQ